MAACSDDERNKRSSQSDSRSDHGFTADFLSLYCSKCFIRKLDADVFPEFIKKLTAVWREHDVVYREFMQGTNWLITILSLVETNRFRMIDLPNGEWVELRLERAKSEFHLRRKPQLVFIAPRHCCCKASGRRAAIDRFLDPTV